MVLEKTLLSVTRDDKIVDTTNNVSYFEDDRKRGVISPFFSNLNYSYDSAYRLNNVEFNSKHQQGHFINGAMGWNDSSIEAWLSPTG